MISATGLTRSRLTHALALLALLLFGWQGAVQEAAGVAFRVAAAAPTTVSPAELTPAHTILPLAPVAVVKPAPTDHRPSAASVPAALSVVASAEPPRPARHADHDAAPLAAAALCPPYAARAPPVFS